MRRAAFVYDDALSRHQLRDDHPMRPVRLQYTYELLQAYGAFDLETSTLVPPRAAAEEELRWLHGAEYISAVQSFSLGLAGYDPSRFNFAGQGDNPTYRGMYDAAALSTGASLAGIPQIKPTFLEIAPSGIPSNIIPHSKGVKCGLIRSKSPFSYSNHRPAKPKIPKPLVYAQVSPLGTSFATP